VGGAGETQGGLEDWSKKRWLDKDRQGYLDDVSVMGYMTHTVRYCGQTRCLVVEYYI
jgi:hypothetical protein